VIERHIALVAASVAACSASAAQVAKISGQIRRWRPHRRWGSPSPRSRSRSIRSCVGWMQYYGAFYDPALNPFCPESTPA
jgi:hypothetical protein